MKPANSDIFDYVLVGGGLQNGLIALALSKLAPSARVLLVERQRRLGGNHIWCFHSGDLDSDGLDLVGPLVAHQWSGYEVSFPRRRRVVTEPYAAVTSERLDRVVSDALARPGSQILLGRQATRISEHEVELDDGRRVHAQVVIEARGPEHHDAEGHVAYQKFLGLELELARPHAIQRPMLMDARVPQTDGFRFFYVLPLSERRVLIEDTYFADAPAIDVESLRRGILDYADAIGLGTARVVREETGSLPLPSRRIPEPQSRLPLVAGYQGGWFHPTTGYSFPAAVRLALHVAKSGPAGLFGEAWRRLVAEHRRQQRFFLFLNRLLFGAFQPADRWNVLERFYGLPEPTIRRFYAMSTTAGDRARVLCGRPPRGLSVRAAFAGGANA